MCEDKNTNGCFQDDRSTCCNHIHFLHHPCHDPTLVTCQAVCKLPAHPGAIRLRSDITVCVFAPAPTSKQASHVVTNIQLPVVDTRYTRCSVLYILLLLVSFKVYILFYTRFSSGVPLHFSNMKHYVLFK